MRHPDKNFCSLTREEFKQLADESDKKSNKKKVLAISHIRANCPEKFEQIVGYPDRKPKTIKDGD